MKHTAAVARSVCGASLLLAAALNPAAAALLQIDPARSQVHYESKFAFCYADASGETICPPPQTATYAVRGQVDVEVYQTAPFDDATDVTDRIRITPVNIVSEALARGLELDVALGVFDGESFVKQADNFCDNPEGFIAACWIWFNGTHTDYSGRWDSETLTWTGYQESFFARFDYTITAVAVAAVPEPATLPLVLAALTALVGAGMQKRCRSIR